MLTTLLPPTAHCSRRRARLVKEGPEVREPIGAALQEAALDPLLTGREHLRLRRAAGAPRAERRRAPTSCSRASASIDAADRKVRATRAA